MSTNRLFYLFIVTALLIVTACVPQGATPPVPVATPLNPTNETSAVPALPFAHTACAEGVDLTGQTISFYHILNPNDQVDTVYKPLRAGYADAAEYFNAHGGICGATLEQVFEESHWGGVASVYSQFAARQPKPVVVTLYGSGDATQLAPQLAQDKIPALNIRGGSVESAYGDDGKTLGWIFATNPLYVDQVGAMCDFIVANPDRFPKPVLGFMNFEEAWAQGASEGSLTYCQSLGIAYAGTSTFSGDGTDLQAIIQKLVDGGANIIYTNSHENGPALVARNLFNMGLRDKVTLATVNRAMDPYVAFSGEKDLDANGVPVISGMLGSLPVRSWAETDNPGIQLIIEQADLHQRPRMMRTDGYIMGWDTTDLFIEAYIQTGNRVGFDHITGAEIKKTLENIVYAPLGGVEQIDYRGGALRALALDRIGEMNYLGQDGKTKAGPGNPPVVVTEGGEQHLVPMIVPLTDYQPAPDLRLPSLAGTSATETPESSAAQVELGDVPGKIAFRSDRSGNNDIYVMNGDGSGLIKLTNDPGDDDLPDWSPDGTRIAFCTRGEVNVISADGSNQVQLTNNSADDCFPSWFPNGTKIVFGSDRDGNVEIYIMSVDGNNQTRLTNDPAFDGMPDWSPDGKHIAFVSDRDGQMDIYLMNADGSGVNRLTTFGMGDIDASNGFPKWSPDGTKIAFASSYEAGHNEIYIMNADGSGVTRLTNGEKNNFGPSWSPDGTQIVFSSERGGIAEIYVMNADGSSQTRLTDNPADDEMAVWQP
jgi:Tol biopolymer transport system component/ABC-type branched-subunit amino acid transport system substrate-binding protein